MASQEKTQTSHITLYHPWIGVNYFLCKAQFRCLKKSTNTQKSKFPPKSPVCCLESMLLIKNLMDFTASKGFLFTPDPGKRTMTRKRCPLTRQDRFLRRGKEMTPSQVDMVHPLNTRYIAETFSKTIDWIGKKISFQGGMSRSRMFGKKQQELGGNRGYRRPYRERPDRPFNFDGDEDEEGAAM